MERVVAVFRIQGDFYVIILASMLAGNLADLVAEIAFGFQDQTADALCRRIGFISDQLLSKWPHTAACLSCSDCAKDPDAGEQSFFWNRQPLRIAAAKDFRWMMNLSDNQKQILSGTRIGIGRE